MKARTRLLVIGALLALGMLGLVVAWTQWGGQIAPAVPLLGLGTPTATVIPTITPVPTPTPTEGEMAAAIVGQEYSNYRPTQSECNRDFESGAVDACVFPTFIEQVTHPDWKRLLPNTRFYVIELEGRYQEAQYDHYRRRRLVAWHDGQYYDADTFDDLLKVNGITAITDENRELVAKALALMTLPGYLEEEVVFIEWVKGDWPDYDYCLKAWTKIKGMEIRWWFAVGEDGHFWHVTRDSRVETGVGDYIDAPAIPLPSLEDYYFLGE